MEKTKEIVIDFKTTPYWGISYASAFEGDKNRGRDCILWISKIMGKYSIIEQYSIDPKFAFLTEKKIISAKSTGKDSVKVKVNELVSTAVMESISIEDFEESNAMLMAGFDSTKKVLPN
jgi:hypothetical protein